MRYELLIKGQLTHYIKKWEGKNLDDLIKLIDLIVHWIEMRILTASFDAEMPEQ
jgi:hypothetical protein